MNEFAFVAGGMGIVSLILGGAIFLSGMFMWGSDDANINGVTFRIGVGFTVLIVAFVLMAFAQILDGIPLGG